MASFDVSSEIDWQEIDNAIHQTLKEVGNRFDFKGLKNEIELDRKNNLLTLSCSEETKLDALNDVFQNKLVKRGVSLLALDYQTVQEASAGSARQVVRIQSGISKEKGKELIKAIKNEKFKVQAQIQDEQVRVTGKSRDILQEVISFLKSKQDTLKVPMQFGNFRD